MNKSTKETLMDFAFFYENENEYKKAFEYVFKVLKIAYKKDSSS